MNNVCGIYKIKNIINNKIYIGQSCSIKNRWNIHINNLLNNKHINYHLQQSWNKYGKDCFEFSIIEECKEERLNEREIYWIDHYKSYDSNFGYNMTYGGEGGKPTEETRKKISDKLKISWSNLSDKKQEVSERMKEQWKDENYKNKMSNTISHNMKLKWQDNEYKEKTSNKLKEVLSTEEYKKGASIRSKERWDNKEYKSKMINTIHNFSSTTEFKEKCKKASLEMWSDPEKREKICGRITEALNRPETKEKLSKSRKEYFSKKENREKLSNKMKGLNAGEKHYAYGKPAHNRKEFSEDQIKQICEQIKLGKSLDDIGKDYNCSKNPIRRIRDTNFTKEEIKEIKQNKKK